MKHIIFAMLGILFTTSCMTQRLQMVMVDGRVFDLEPRLYSESDSDWQRLNAFIDKADCIIDSSCHQGMSVMNEKGEWACRLSDDEVKEQIAGITNNNLAVVWLSEYDDIENLARQNARVTTIINEYNFHEIIIVKDDVDGLLLKKYNHSITDAVETGTETIK